MPPPSLGALRLLEAAARRRSYSLAGVELNLTHSAISQQVRRLEEGLGRRLFERRGLRMEPSPEALELAQAYVAAQDILEQSWERLSWPNAPSVLVVTMLASFARAWFAPRLAGLRQALPDLEFELRTGRAPANFDGDGVDVAIRMGEGGWRGLEATHLFEDRVFPVCSPDLVERYDLRRPADLLRAPLLLELRTPWSVWFEAAGVAVDEPMTGDQFDDSALALDAAADGFGVALCRGPLAQEALAAGRVVRLFNVDAATGQSGWFVWKPGTSKEAAILRLRDWIVSEVATAAWN
jgi:LysR family glycine cleavage system transcriptional activator